MQCNHRWSFSSPVKCLTCGEPLEKPESVTIVPCPAHTFEWATQRYLMDSHDWLARRSKLIKWEVFSVTMALHPCEAGFIRKAIQSYREGRTLNEYAEEVYQHLMMRFEAMETPHPYPGKKLLVEGKSLINVE